MTLLLLLAVVGTARVCCSRPHHIIEIGDDIPSSLMPSDDDWAPPTPSPDFEVRSATVPVAEYHIIDIHDGHWLNACRLGTLTPIDLGDDGRATPAYSCGPGRLEAYLLTKDLNEVRGARRVLCTVRRILQQWQRRLAEGLRAAASKLGSHGVKSHEHCS